MKTSTNIREYFIFKNKGRNNEKLTFNSIGYRICNLDACNNLHKAKGYCSKHYLQYSKFGEIKTNKKILDLEGEIWMPVIGYENLYHISNKGRVKSLKKIREYRDSKDRCTEERLLKPSISYFGYLYITLFKNKKTKPRPVHVLVCECFLEKPDKNKNQVNHINFNKLDNTPKNLEWVTARENTVHYVKSRKCKSKYVGVTKHKPTGKWRSRITINGKRTSLGLFYSEVEAHKAVERIASTL